MKKYILLEGLPGAGKTTYLNEAGSRFNYNLVPDFGNPAELGKTFQMDWRWIVEIECQKSRLAVRGNADIVFQERGYLSVLAVHYMLEQLNEEKTFSEVTREIAKLISSKIFILPHTIIVINTTVEQSCLRQPGTRLNMWKDPQKLALIQNYYFDYAKDPMFGEKIVIIDSNTRAEEIDRLVLE